MSSDSGPCNPRVLYVNIQHMTHTHTEMHFNQFFQLREQWKARGHRPDEKYNLGDGERPPSPPVALPGEPAAHVISHGASWPTCPKAIGVSGTSLVKLRSVCIRELYGAPSGSPGDVIVVSLGGNAITRAPRVRASYLKFDIQVVV